MNRILSRTIAALLLSTAAASAQLNWGADGAGGDGTWDATTSNWFDGTGNVPWDNTTAVFGGTGGAVSLPGTVQASQLIFNTPGYVISGNGVIASPTDGTLNITTNADATINSFIKPISAGAGLATLVKEGAGTLIVGDGRISNYPQILINSGTLDFHGFENVGAITLANTPSAVLTVGLAFIGGLNGGGANGGVVRPEGADGGLLHLYGTGSFAGSLQNNGGIGILAVDVYPTGFQTLSGTNTYSGLTSVGGGTLIFARQGTAQKTSGIDIGNNGTLVLDNSSANNTNRLPDAAAITLSGSLVFIGNKITSASETLGGLTIEPIRTSYVTVVPDSAQSSTLTFSSVTNATNLSAGLVVYRGTNLGAAPAAGVANIRMTTAPTLIGSGGGAGSKTMSIAPYAVGDFSSTGAGSSFITYDVNGLRPLADTEYANNDFTIAGANASVDGTAVVPAAVSVTSLRLKNGAHITGGGTLSVTNGMILQLPGVSNINNARLDFGTNAIVMDIEGTTNISSVIAGNSSRGIDKLGSGRLVLSGANVFGGPMYIADGVVNIQNASALGTSGTVTVALGAALEVQGGIHVGNVSLVQGGGLGASPASGALRSVSGDNIWDGNIGTQGSALTIGVDTGSFTINGTFSTGGGYTKVGNGSLIFAKSFSPVSSGAGSVAGGWLISTATSGYPIETLNLSNAGFQVAPSGSGGAISLLSSGTVTYNGGASLGISKGGNSSVSATILLTRGGSNSTLVIIPGSGLAALGGSERLTTTLPANGSIAPASVVGQDNDINRSGTFLHSDSNNVVTPATYGPETDLNAATGTTVFQVNTDQTLTADRSVFALQNNGHVIDLGGRQLTFATGSWTSGIILNGGSIRNGTLNLSGSDGAIYTSLAGGAITTPIVTGGSAGIAFFGPGKLTLSSASAYTGNTYVNGGNLNLQGSITSQVFVAPTAVLSGTGRTTHGISGGTISPGNGGAGILTADSVGIQEVAGSTTMGTYTNFAFQFTKTGLPTFGSATASGNDVLHLTDPSAAFTGGALGDANEVDLYFNVPFGLQAGQTYVGGFFADQNAAFDGSIGGADYHVFVSDPAGTTTFDGVTYSSFDSSALVVSTVPLTADFGSGAVNGYGMQVQVVVPESGSLSALLGGVLVIGARCRRRQG